MIFIVVLDACVLYPAPLRDLLMRLAVTSLYAPKWTDVIHDEWSRNLLRKRPELEGRLPRVKAQMNAALPDANVTGYEGLVSGINLPDPDDRHVVAAAIAARADAIVTFNLKDFPAAELEKYGLEVIHPDVFIRGNFDLDPSVALSAVRAMRSALKNPPCTAEELLDILSRQGLPDTVAFLRDWTDHL